jgi:hypothetical protein
MTTANSYSICLFDKPFDAINDKFFVRMDKNLNKKIWLGACLLEVVRKTNFIGCSGHGKGTYAIDQSSSTAYSYNNPNNYATLSNHHYSDYNASGYNASKTAVIFCLFIGLDIKGRGYFDGADTLFQRGNWILQT